ncbi:MAG: ATP-grasp domain-containing protein [Methylovulum sp.]|nr:ATP-grasp domain-containing protein [Methylovulum sp.]
MIIPQYILIISNSARMLAQAAANTGMKPLVIDLFADLDTQRYAQAFCKTPSLAVAHLVTAVDFFIKRYAVTHAIYGSGFEYYPESLHYLDTRLILLGNTPDTFARLQNKADFFTVLTDLDISYPEVSFTVPDGPMWLVKPLQGQGGVGIKHYQQASSEQSIYWQQYQQGTPQSVLFLADGKRAQVIGFNTQWTVNSSAGETFIFSGVINSSSLSIKQKTLISGWLARLVPEYGLNGLNSMDFIQYGKGIYVLEINPRLSASMQLYDANVLIRHIRASQGDITDEPLVQEGYTGYQIIYAGQDGVIPDAMEWPEMCMDLPQSGVNYRKGQPICSIICRHSTPRTVFGQLQFQQQQLLNQLQTGSP